MIDYEMKQKVHHMLLDRAALYKKPLYENIVRPEAMVLLQENELGNVEVIERKEAEIMKEKSLSKGEKLILDFGDHQVGYVTLNFNLQRGPQDSPAYIRLKFGEVAKEIMESSEDYHGWVSKSWIQEEYIHIDSLPTKIELPRRYAFRYLELEVIDTSKKWELVLEDAECRTVSAVGTTEDKVLTKTNEMVRDIFSDPLKKEMEQMCKVSIRTLRNCMQDVFEDGPKRDRRLWLGDLRLQALANYATFQNYDLVKRCLYLFAGITREDGKISACLFVEPKYQADNTFFFDYSLFFISALKDYYEATKDKVILDELWNTAKTQLLIASKEFDEDGWIRRDTLYNSFIDWKDGLDKQSCSQAVYIYAAKDLKEIARILDKQDDIKWIENEIVEKEAAAIDHAWDEKLGVFISGENRQISYASQTWMILAGVIDTKKGKEVLARLEKMDSVVGMVTPYMNHHYTEALFLCGENEKAVEYLRYYWGGMLKQGADTFWEVYNPENPQESPYGSSIVNSYCHAWSCTPVYLIWKYMRG